MTPLDVTWPVQPTGKQPGLHFPACIRTCRLYHRRLSLHPTAPPRPESALLRESKVIAQAEWPLRLRVWCICRQVSVARCGCGLCWGPMRSGTIELIQTAICVKLEPLRIVGLELLKDTVATRSHQAARCFSTWP